MIENWQAEVDEAVDKIKFAGIFAIIFLVALGVSAAVTFESHSRKSADLEARIKRLEHIQDMRAR